DPFDDTDNVFVIIAHYLHIVNGVSERTFAPDNAITRQEAAAMLSRIAEAFEYSAMGGVRVNFADSRLFAPWASEAIEFVSSNGIMGGIGNDEFSPLGLYTREQTFVTMIRLAAVVE
ncbi:MAG: S-layer homology domain-containing protein, partial [Oscillospiraceae bacterium]|nr:S-layer homology domain-containing protein [Oscillospiraceae bacterium]